MADPLAAKLAAQVRSHTAALSEIREACYGQPIASTMAGAWWKLGQALNALENAIGELERGEEGRAT